MKFGCICSRCGHPYLTESWPSIEWRCPPCDVGPNVWKYQPPVASSVRVGWAA